MPVVSVIIPTYKHRDYVLQTLESVFAQSFTDYEVIVVNDGSPDDTAEVLRPLADAGRIRYIEQINAGQSAARNRGIAEANGEYIALLDDDDLWPPDKLEWQVELLRTNPDATLVSGNVEIIDEQGKQTGQIGTFKEQISLEDVFEGNGFTSPGQTLIRACLLREVGGLNERIWGADDFDLWIQLRSRGEFILRSKIALLYRKHTGNASHNHERMLENLHHVLQLHLHRLPSARRRPVMRKGYTWLYDYAGHKSIYALKDSWQRRKPGLFWHNVKNIGIFIHPGRTDLQLIVKMLKDVATLCAPRLARSGSAKKA